MSEIGHLMKSAADQPTSPPDVEAAWHKGKSLRNRRAILLSASVLILVAGAGIGLARTIPGWAPLAPAQQQPAPAPSEETTCAEEVLPEEDAVAHCIARGVLEGEPWFYGAYLDEKGDLCTYLIEPGMAASGSCGNAEPPRRIGVGTSGGGPAGPILTAETPEQAERVVVETRAGEQIEASVYEPPSELPLRMRFVLLFELPREAERVIAYDGTGREIDRRSLDLFHTDELEMDPENAGGWIIANGMIDDEPWGLSARQRPGGGRPCAELGLGNDAEAADVEIGATACFETSESHLALEQVWWDGLEARAPVFGIVGRDVHSIEMHLEGQPVRRVPIRRSPQGGPGQDEPVYEVDFMVAFPPLGAPGEIRALDDGGRVIATWTLCLSARPEGTHSSCDPGTQFWFPPEGDSFRFIPDP